MGDTRAVSNKCSLGSNALEAIPDKWRNGYKLIIVLTKKDLLDLSQATAKKAGLPGIKFIAVTAGPMLERERAYGLPTKWTAKNPSKPWEGGQYENKQLLQEYVPRLKEMGFEGMTAYVYHNFMDKDNKSYADMRETYKGHWNMWSEKFKNDPNFEYQVPVAMGWDMRPAGGTWGCKE